ncbi:MAG: copper chaperone [Bacteroidia bacterium]|jgi:copper chaperone CopZ|uniref:HMA domain-containing protein n=1 Tax=bioreactor metagenome TaxID=1076179 RepID=A0A644YZP0_9ZZZZ|nr:heavy-metal-associated domain-containing protein [Rikenellaceae bacterium]NCB19831.1 copper chaperone [Bacteroidia bacterium]
MKTIQLVSITILSALILISGGLNAQSKNVKKDAEVLFSVPVDCPSCQKKLEAKLPYEKGVKDMKIDLEKQTIWFLYSPDKTNKEALVKALDKLGYPAVEVTKGKDGKSGEEKK